MWREVVRCLHGCGKCVRLGSASRCWEDVLLERGATYHLCGVSGERKFGASGPSVFGVHKECFVQFGRGMKTGRPKNTFWLEPRSWRCWSRNCCRLWAGRAPAVSWAPEWVPFEILVWADNIFLVSSSIIDKVKRTQEIADVFWKRGLRFNESSLEILPSKKGRKRGHPYSLQ